MDLFDTSEVMEILPYDGSVQYYGPILSLKDSQYYYKKLLATISWKNDTAKIFGKLIVTKRKIAWYGDESFNYTYSNTSKTALPWTSELLELKKIVEERTNETFNSCLLNLYHSGEEGMGWHSDGEKYLKLHGAIGSLSLGAQRRFLFKHKETKLTVPVYLEKGSLLVMKGETQKYWLHRLPPTKKVKTPRINLTFRTIDFQ